MPLARLLVGPREAQEAGLVAWAGRRAPPWARHAAPPMMHGRGPLENDFSGMRRRAVRDHGAAELAASPTWRRIVIGPRSRTMRNCRASRTNSEPA